MRLKLVVAVLYAVGLVLPLGLDTPAHQQSKAIRLDASGERGVVGFDHKLHEIRINPDRNAVHQAKVGAACAGCHHTVSPRGVPQLWKCATCHRREGDSNNPKDSDFDELHTERAFHDKCIGCHRTSNHAEGAQKAPVTCGDCHESISGN